MHISGRGNEGYNVKGGGVGSSHKPNGGTRYVWSGARASDGLGVRHAPWVLANCRWWPDFLGPRRRAGASVVSIGVTGVGGVELSRISMVMSSAVVTWLVLVFVIPVLVGALGSDVKGSLPLPSLKAIPPQGYFLRSDCVALFY